MQLANTQSHYGLISISLHWVIAGLIIGLFSLGIWMVELDYYESCYQQTFWWHKGLGIISLLVMFINWLFQSFNPVPIPLAGIAQWQRKISIIVHLLMNALIVLIGISGYLIVTAKGQGLIVFDWFTIPAVVNNIVNLEDKAGYSHYIFAYVLITLVMLHITAALIHHFVYNDKTLVRIFGQ